MIVVGNIKYILVYRDIGNRILDHCNAHNIVDKSFKILEIPYKIIPTLPIYTGGEVPVAVLTNHFLDDIYISDLEYISVDKRFNSLFSENGILYERYDHKVYLVAIPPKIKQEIIEINIDNLTNISLLSLRHLKYVKCLKIKSKQIVNFYDTMQNYDLNGSLEVIEINNKICYRNKNKWKII